MCKKLTTEEFIEKARLVHGDKYHYSKVEYVNSAINVIIVCTVHGEFQQRPGNHLSGKGCMKCGVKTSSAKRTKTPEEFIEAAKAVHKNKYKYVSESYKGIEKKLIVLCPAHGEFEQKASTHLSGHGCLKCQHQSNADRLRKSTEDVVAEFKKVHENKYDCSKVLYVDMRTKVKIICPEHNEFEQTPVAHLAGQGCPSCAKTGFDKSRSGILYYLRVAVDDCKELYKVGVTNRSVNERFSLSDLQKIKIVKVEEFELGQDAWDKEKEILTKYKEYKYTGPDVLDSGNTELFTIDVLALEK